MLTWFDLLTRLIRQHDDDDASMRAEVTAVAEEQRALAPVIDAQTDYLVTKAELNGFTRQLRAGFHRRDATE